MANTFLTSDFVFNAARDAALLLQANLVASNLMSREIESQLRGVPTVGPSGGSVKVKVIASDVANTQDHKNNAPSTLSVTDVTESSVDIDCLTYKYVKKTLNTKEKTWELDDFARKFTAPAVVGLANSIDQFMIARMAGGFASNMSGTEGTAASTVAHILAARKVMQDNLVPLAPRVAILGTTVEASFLAIDQFTNRDYGEDGADALRRAALSTRYGINWYVDQNAGGDFDQGDIAGTVLTNGAGTPGASTLAVDGFTAGTGYVREGTRFTVAGDSTVYTTTDDAVISGNAATLPITPVASASIAAGGTAGDNAALTFKTAFKNDFIYHPGMVAGAIVAPPPLFSNSAVASFGGLSIRVTFESSTSGTSGAVDTVLYDVYVGNKVIRPEGGVILQGG